MIGPMTRHNDIDEQERTRREYSRAFVRQMVLIWKEKIAALNVVDTGMLLQSVYNTMLSLDPSAFDIDMGWQFREYGIYQNYGTGRDTPRGNSGDLGRPKVRIARRWFDIKYFASIMNMRDFLAESVGDQFIGIFSNAFHSGGLSISVGSRQP